MSIDLPSIFDAAQPGLHLALAENSSEFIGMCDLCGVPFYANPAAMRLVGLDNLEQVTRTPVKDFFFPEDQPFIIDEFFPRVLRDGRGEVEIRFRHFKTGRPVWMVYTVWVVKDKLGAPVAIATVSRDITDRMRAQALLDAQKHSLELVASGVTLPQTLAYLTHIVEQQADGNVVASILLLDDQGRLHTGAAPSLPDDYNSAIDGLVARADLGTCSVAAATGKVVITPDIDADPKWHCIKHLPASQGLKAAWSQPIFNRHGRVLGTFGTYFRECRGPSAMERQVVEILSHTAALAIERKLADEERERLLASERAARADADAANRAKDRFLAVLSHELRTPLSPVVMTIPAIEIDPELPLKFREDLAMVRRNIDLEVKLIDDLLDLNRITSGKLRLQMQPVRVHELLRHVIHSSRVGEAPAAGKQLDIREELGAADDRLTADPARLQQVFWNLLRNAIKFTPDGGTITVRTSNPGGRGTLLVEIIDSGVGIPADLLPRIFGAFEQGDARVTRQFGGLGLGLAIAKAVIQMHAGQITAASDGEGRGATFAIRLQTGPAQPATARAAPPTRGDAVPAAMGSAAEPANGNGQHAPPGAAAPANATRTRILLVEDHADTARTLARLLRSCGYEVSTAHTMTTALQLAAAEPFDIVLSDIGLPDATGYDLMAQLRDRHRLKGIALSGYGMEEDLRRSREVGFVDHVIKPVNMHDLESLIRRVTAKQQSV